MPSSTSQVGKRKLQAARPHSLHGLPLRQSVREHLTGLANILCCEITMVQTSQVSVQFSSAIQSYPTLCDPMDRSTTGLPVYPQLLQFTQTHVRRVGAAIQPSHPLLSPSPPAFNLSQHQGLFIWVCSLHQVSEVKKSPLPEGTKLFSPFWGKGGPRSQNSLGKPVHLEPTVICTLHLTSVLLAGNGHCSLIQNKALTSCRREAFKHHPAPDGQQSFSFLHCFFLIN